MTTESKERDEWRAGESGRERERGDVDTRDGSVGEGFALDLVRSSCQWDPPSRVSAMYVYCMQPH